MLFLKRIYAITNNVFRGYNHTHVASVQPVVGHGGWQNGAAAAASGSRRPVPQIRVVEGKLTGNECVSGYNCVQKIVGGARIQIDITPANYSLEYVVSVVRSRYSDDRLDLYHVDGSRVVSEDVRGKLCFWQPFWLISETLCLCNYSVSICMFLSLRLLARSLE